jgi:hypothetical protein
MLGEVEISHLATEPDFEIGAVEPLDQADATFARTDLVPDLGNIKPERGDKSCSSDDNSPGHPEFLSETERTFQQFSVELQN